MDDRKIIVAANSFTEKYFFEPEFSGIPKPVQDDLRILSVTAANTLRCVFIIGFHQTTGNLYFETWDEETDEITARTFIEKVRVDQHELIQSLSLWHKIFIRKEIDDLND